MRIRRIQIDRTACIGSGQCVLNAPGVFELDDESVSTVRVKDGQPTSGPVGRAVLAEDTDDDVLVAAAQACPVKAIRLEDEDGTAIFP